MLNINRRRITGMIFAVMLTLLMTAGLAPARVYADDPTITYVDRYWDGSQVVTRTGNWPVNISEYFNSETTELKFFYIVSGRVDNDNRPYVPEGSTAFILLMDGAKLYCEDGIKVPSGATLNIFCQEGGTGELYCDADTNDNAAIGADNEDGDCGTINIYGGVITADSEDLGTDAAGIGGGDEGSGGTVSIFGGTVKAKGGARGAGIGGGDRDSDKGGNGGETNIYGGYVEARGGTNGAGIGGGELGNGGTINIYGGTVKAYGGEDGAGLGSGDDGGNGGTISIYGGEVYAEGGSCAAGIGGGQYGSGGTVLIDSSGRVDASGGKWGAGIGGGNRAGGGSIVIENGKVTASGGDGGAGIGGGDGGNGNSGDISIKGGEVTATGGDEAAGIGGGNQGNESNTGTITISGGTVKATGGPHFGAGIGGGDQQEGGTIKITGGDITATAQIQGAGIGGGDRRGAGNITIEGGKVKATGGDGYESFGGGAGIGTGFGALEDGHQGTVTINGGEIDAKGIDRAAGIGGGYEAMPSTVTINDGTVQAQGAFGGGAGIGSGVKGSWQNNTSVTINGGDVTAIGGEAEQDGAWAFYTGAAIGCGGMHTDGYSPTTSDFKGSINLNGGTIHASYAGENLLGVVLIGNSDPSSSSKITIKAKCRIYVDKGNSNRGKRLSPMDAATITFEDITEGSTVYSSKVYNTDNTSDIALAADRKAWCTAQNDNKSIAIVPCDHSEAQYADKGDAGHSISCPHCTASGTERTENHVWGDAAYTWKADNSEVTATHTCTKCGRAESETVNTTVQVIKLPNCKETGESNYTAVFTKTGFEEQKREGVTVPIDPNNHDWGEPTYEWAADNSSVTAMRTCSRDHAHVETETAETTSRVTKPATCEEKGETTYTATFKGEAFRQQTKTVEDINLTDHDWGEPTYEWAADNSSVTAKRVCKINSSHIETETVNTTSEITKQPACTEKGETTYTSAAFENDAFKVQTKTVDNIDPLDHEWGEPTYEWAANNRSVTASRVCARDESHVERETQDAFGAYDLPTCEEKGWVRWTSFPFDNKAFGEAVKMEELAPLGHDWGEASYEWAADNSSVTATHVCSRDATHVETETVETTSEVTKAATCEEKGETTYTAEFEGEAFEARTKTVEDIDALGHDWDEPVYEWTRNNSSVIAERFCKNDRTHHQIEKVSVTSEITKEPGCEEDGVKTYTSESFRNEAFEVQTETEVIKALGHDWDEGTVTKQPTTTEEGVKTFRCKRCDAARTESIPKLKPTPTPTPKPEPKPTPAPAQKAGGMLIAKMTSKRSSAMNIGWNKVNGASGYDVFLAKCNSKGKKYACKRVKTIKGNKTFKWTKTGLKKGTSYKGYVKAYVMKNGKKTYVSTSPVIHVYGGSGTKRYTNAKSLTVNRPKVALKKGKTFKIKAKIGKVRKNKKLMPSDHIPSLRYKTSSAEVATVNKSGKITAKGKGTCYIYVFTHNGISKQIKVTVN